MHRGNRFKCDTHTAVQRLLILGVAVFSFLFLPATVPIAHAAETIYDGTNTALNGDDSSTEVPIGFSFTYYGNTYTNAHVSTNGLILFGTGSSAYSNVAIPTAAAPNNMIAAFWDDLTTDNASGYKPSIYYTTQGSAPNRVFIVQWTNMYFYGTTVQMGTFQAYLYESSNTIRVQYRNLLGGSRAIGDSATIGLENSDGSAGVQYSNNSASLTEKQSILFTPSGGTYTMDSASTYQEYFLRDASNPAPDVPTLSSPADAATELSTLPTLTWNAAANATSYKVIVSSTANFSSVVVNQAGITGTSHTLVSALNKGTTYYWRVEASNANGNALSEARSFTTKANVTPTAPSSLGDAAVVDGSYRSGRQPSFSATLADTDAEDTVRYQIQIDDSADFSSLVVNFTSALAAQGARTFTVGQAVSGGSYAAGSSGQTLSDGAYYWRVRTLDNSGATSGWSTANSGAIAFRIDGTAPSISGTPAVTSPTTNTSPTFTWTAATEAGIGLASPAYTVEWSQSATFASGVSSGTSNTTSFTITGPLADGAWYFRVRATDLLTNIGSNSSTASVTIDTTVPTTPGTPSTTSPTTDTTPIWTWTSSTDGGVGLASPAYSLEWSQSSSFSSAVFSTTTNSASYTHSTTLADGTWYFRVRASDSVGNLSALSTSGVVLIDTTAPTTPGTPTVSAYTTSGKPSLSWTAATDVGAGLASPAYTLEWSSSASFSTITGSATTSTSSYTFASALSTGRWYFRVRASDSLANSSSNSTTTSTYVDTTAPTVPGTLTTTTPTSVTSPVISWTVSSDGHSGLSHYVLQWSQSADFSGTVVSASTNDATYTHTSALSDGVWHYRVFAYDLAGNISSVSDTMICTVDASAPTGVVVSTKSSSTTFVKPTWTWTSAIDTGVGLATTPYLIEWSQSSTFSTGVNSAETALLTFTPTSSLRLGTWYLRVRTKDALGNTSAPSTAVAVRIYEEIPIPASIDIPETTTVDVPVKSSSDTPLPTPTPTTYDVSITVTDTNGNPVAGARVELSSGEVAYSDQNGIVSFTQISRGEKEVVVFFRDQQARTSLTVGPGSNTVLAAEDIDSAIDLKIALPNSSFALHPWIIPSLTFLAGMGVMYVLIGRRRKNNEEAK